MNPITALFLVLGCAILGLLLFWHAWFWSRRLKIPVEYALEERITTDDGACIELRRLPLPPTLAPLPPVLIVHGVGANHRNIDLSEDLSIARHLRARGRDVWLLTLRSGIAHGFVRSTRRVRFSAMVRQDLPLAVAEVLARSGASELDYVGYSMGGMLLYAAIGRTLSIRHIRRVVIIASPAIVRPPLSFRVPAFAARIPELMYPTLRLRLAARMSAFAIEWWRSPAHHWVLNPANVAPGVARASLVNIVEDIPGSLNREFVVWAATNGGAITLDGERVLDRLGDLTTPVLFFAGSADRIAPPDSVRAAFEAWGARHGSVEKRFVVLGREHGFFADYGHADLAVGLKARQELFEPLADFLQSST